MTNSLGPLKIPSRRVKPRTTGITSMYDIGMPSQIAKSYLDDFAEIIDIAKLAVGTGYVMPNVREKVELYKSYGIKVQFGGTLFEKFYSQGLTDEYINYIKDRGIDTLEISDGTIDIQLDDIYRMIDLGLESSLTVLVEFGSKDPEKIISPAKWVSSIQNYLRRGAHYVITESRDSGSAGMFRPSGELRTGLVQDIGNEVDIDRVLFEAPTPKSQMHFINTFGPNVNLANVKPNDILVLEAERIGLRYETFGINDRF